MYSRLLPTSPETSDSDRRAVSPVVAVALMLAITVAMAAIVVPFMLGQTDQVESPAPDSEFAFAYSEEELESSDSFGTDSESDDFTGTLTIVLESGDSIPAGELNISGSSSSGNLVTDGSYDEDDDILPGEEIDVFVKRGDGINVIWHSSEGGESAILASFTVRPTE